MLACTKRFSLAAENKMDSLSIAGVIPVMDGIHLNLSKTIDNTVQAKPAHIRWGASRARLLIDKYYSKTDESSLYRVAICKSDCSVLNTFIRLNAIIDTFLDSPSPSPSCRFHAEKQVAGRRGSQRPRGWDGICGRPTTPSVVRREKWRRTSTKRYVISTRSKFERVRFCRSSCICCYDTRARSI